MTKQSLLDYIDLIESEETGIYEGDGFYFVLDEDTGVETEVLKAWEDAVLVELDHTALSLLQDVGAPVHRLRRSKRSQISGKNCAFR